jgi:hypothetical protein
MDILRNPEGAVQSLIPHPPAQAQGSSLVFDLATTCVEVVDHSYGTTDPAIWTGVIRTLEERLTQSGAIPDFADAVSFVRKWQLYFRSLRADNEVPESKRQEVRVEASDLSKMLKGWLAQRRR